LEQKQDLQKIQNEKIILVHQNLRKGRNESTKLILIIEMIVKSTIFVPNYIIIYSKKVFSKVLKKF